MCHHRPVKRKLFLLFGAATIEFSLRKAKGPEMHLLRDSYPGPTIHRDLPNEPLPVTQDPGHRLADSSMDHLDALEAQSIYIFREAFARLKKLALLWSLGK